MFSVLCFMFYVLCFMFYVLCFMLHILRFRSSGFRVQGLGFRFQGLGFQIRSWGARWGFGSRGTHHGAIGILVARSRGALRALAPPPIALQRPVLAATKNGSIGQKVLCWRGRAPVEVRPDAREFVISYISWCHQ